MHQDFINFVRKTYNKPKGFIPLHEPTFGGKEKKYSDTAQVTDDLFFEYARILKGLQPKFFIAELTGSS